MSASGEIGPAGRQDKTNWLAVYAMALGVFGLVTAEFLPASLLTPMAAALGVTEGIAGQAVTATAIPAVLTSIFITAATQKIDRRLLLILFSLLLIVSNLLVGFASNLVVLLIGRVFLGIALGGFWAMATATAMRLVPEHVVPRALAIIFSAVSAATVVAAPLGSYLGSVFGWRTVFLFAAVLGAAAFVMQVASLPRMPPSGTTRLSTLIEVLRRPRVGLGMISVMLVFGGHFALFTYIRPFLETVSNVGTHGLAIILLVFGVANFFGTLLAGRLLERSLRLTLVLMPALMGVVALGLAGSGSVPVADAAMIALWGVAFGGVPVAWTTWITREIADEAESAGGLIVAAIQVAIALGAAVGGGIMEQSSVVGVFTTSGVVLLFSAALIFVGMRQTPEPVAEAA